MKLEKALKLKTLFSLIFILIISAEISSAFLKKTVNEESNILNTEAERHKSHSKKKSHTGEKNHQEPAAPQPLVFNSTNNSVSQVLWNKLNNSFTKQEAGHFKVSARKWLDNKLYDRQLDLIFKDFLHESDKEINPLTTRNSINLFTSQYDACDQNKNGVLNLEEFRGCFGNDTFLSRIQPPNQLWANYANNSKTDETGFYSILFNTLDAYKTNYLNFYDYMLIRLFVFSWSKCSVNGPFIEELNFECAIDVAAGWRAMSRTSARRLYQLALDLSNTRQNREIDFVTYVLVAHSVRLYGLINNRDNSDATRDEFNRALDSNLLPQRYNQDVVNQLFSLIQENDKPHQGVDLLSFVFYDFALKLFHVPNATKKWNLNLQEFKSTLSNYLFPTEALQEFNRIPQNNLTSEAYKMYTYLNISSWNDEENHFLKFSQKNEKVSKERSRTKFNSRLLPANFTFDQTNTAKFIFQILDNNMDGYINFYDFGTFVQVSYIFAKLDPYKKGKVLAGDLFDRISNWSEYPFISSSMRERGRRFNMLNQDLYVDLMRALSLLRIDDLMEANVRRSDKTSLYEIELKHIFSRINLAAVPDGYLNKCLRGADENGIPKYDWECAFIQSMKLTLLYFESSTFYATTIGADLTLSSTKFWNVDPQFAGLQKEGGVEEGKSVGGTK